MLFLFPKALVCSSRCCDLANSAPPDHQNRRIIDIFFLYDTAILSSLQIIAKKIRSKALFVSRLSPQVAASDNEKSLKLQ
jgi:hypothetical protein